MCFRVAVRSVEAWLLADRETIVGFLAVELSRVPLLPESEADPKKTLIALARHSRNPEVRRAMVPQPESGRAVGPAYSSFLKEYIENHWRPGIAARSSDSLRRCLVRLRELVGRR